MSQWVEKFRHQATLGARSVRAIVREPSLGGEFPRLLATMGRSPLTMRLPWLPFVLIDHLAQQVDESTSVFEFGGGGSTLWFLDRGARVVTVEHNDAWATALADRISSTRWELLRRSGADQFRSYVDSISSCEDDSLDVVLVDGRERSRCIFAAQSKVKPGGTLIVDDSDRPRYAAAITATRWPRQEFVGFAPGKPTLAYSTVLTRPVTE